MRTTLLALPLVLGLVLVGGCAPRMILCGQDGPVPDSLANETRCETDIRAERADAARAEDIRLCIAQGGAGDNPVGCRQAADPVR